MIEANKTVTSYIKQLLPIGIEYLLVGIACLVILFIATKTDPLINIPFAVVGIFFGYHLATNVNRGGQVTRIFVPRKWTADEKTLYQLVVTYKSKKVVTLTTLLIMLVISVVNLSHYTVPNIFNLNNIIWLVFWTSLTMGMLGTGVKYISAWWNIRKNMKK